MQFTPPSYVTIDGRKIAYDEVTPAQSLGNILLLTGLGSKRLGWYKQLPVFGQQYRTVAIDHRDVGDSDLTNTPYTTADQADDAAAVLHALGMTHAHVIGISMGGAVAMHVAIRYPQLVSKLVLTATWAGGSSFTAPAPAISALLLRSGQSSDDIGMQAIHTYTHIMAPGYLAAHPEDADHIAAIARYRPPSPEAYMRQLQSLQSHDVTAQLPYLMMPTLVVHGEVDPLVPFPNGQYLAEHIAGAAHHFMPATGHIPIIERADEYNQQVLAFLTTSGSRGPSA